MKEIKVIIATHKKYEMPEDKLYLPVHVGKEGKKDIGYKGDNTGDNISTKNPFFCELTGLYWAWKNLDVDYIGLAHYRRHFSMKKNLPKDVEGRVKSVLTYDEAKNILDRVDIILPQKRKYYIEDLYSHYKHTLFIEPLDETGKIIKEKYPEYFAEFEKLHKRTSAHMFNMFIMKREYLNEYCEWLFDILFELEKKIDVSQYNTFHARFFGRVSELLLDVWINTKKLRYEEVKVIDIEKVNWRKKGFAFFKAKLTSKRYEGSF